MAAMNKISMITNLVMQISTEVGNTVLDAYMRQMKLLNDLI